jgi:hypothetical protein
MEHNRELRNKSVHLQSIDSQQRCQEHTQWKKRTVSLINSAGKTEWPPEEV